MTYKTFSRNAVAISFALLLTCNSSLWSQVWVQKANLLSGRSGSVGFTINDKIYVADGTGNAAFQVYDPVTDVWTSLPDLPVGRAGHHGGISFVINGKAYIGLGISDNWQQNLWEFDPSSNMWTQKASLPGIGREGSACFVMNNKAYIIGGAEVNRMRQVWAYDPETDIWTAKANFPAGPIIYAAGFAINNKGYVQGGYPDDLANNVTNRIYEYNDSTDHWTLKAACPGPGRQGHTAFVTGGKAYLGLGVDRDYQQYYTTFYSFDPDGNTWAPEEVFPAEGRMLAFATAAGGKGYVGGGTTIGSTFDDFFSFDPNVTNTSIAEPGATYCSISCYPNPANDELHIAGINEASCICYYIYDLNGKKILSGQLCNRSSIAIGHLGKGYYLLTLQSGKVFTSLPFVKK